MIKSTILVFCFCITGFFGANAWPQETVGQLYTNPENTLSWWTRFTNRYSWLSQKLGTRYKFERSMGVVIAIGDYDKASDFDDLASPAGDAMRMKDFLINEADFDQVYVLINDDASSANIRALMDRFIPTIVGPNDRLLVYWSGHGGSATDSSGRPYGFLALQEATKDGRLDSIHMDDTRRWLRRTQARHVLFVFDACYSGLTLQTASAQANDPAWEQIAAASEFLLTSSASNQESYGHSDGSGGLFTTAFLEGARGAADTNRDGLATITEIALHTETRLREGHLFSQTSQFGPIGQQEGRFFFPSGIEPESSTPPTSRLVEPMGGPCAAATTDYKSFVEDTQQCGTVELFLERYAERAECFAYELANQRKNELCSSSMFGAEEASLSANTDSINIDSYEENDQSRIDALINRIEGQLGDFKLTTPSDDNANDLLFELEQLDPTNPVIKQFRQSMRATYSNWIERQLSRGSLDQANRYLRALGLVPGSEELMQRLHEQIASYEAQQNIDAPQNTDDVKTLVSSSDIEPTSEPDIICNDNLGGMSRQIGGIIGTSTTVLSSVSSSASAEDAVERLSNAEKTLDAFLLAFRKCEDNYMKSALESVIETGLDRLRPVAEAAFAREGVEPVLGIRVRSILSKLSSISSV